MSKRTAITLVLILLAGVAVRYAAFCGYYGGDDRAYISSAYELAHGRFVPNGAHWQARLGVVVPTAVLYRSCGPSLVTSVAVPFCYSIAGIFLALFMARLLFDDENTGLLAALLLAFYPLDVLLASQLFPAMGISFWSACAFLLAYVGERRKTVLPYVGAGLCVGIAYLHRVTGLYAVLPLGVFLMYSRQLKIRHIAAFAAFAAVVACESAVFWWLCGEPLHRWEVLSGIAANVAVARDELRWGGELISPLVSLVTNQEYGLYFVIVLLAALVLYVRKDRRSYPVVLFFIVVSLYTLWGTTSVKSYNNLRPWPRYMSIVSIVAVVLLARWLHAFVSPRWRVAVVSCLVLSSLLCVYLDNSRTVIGVSDELLAWKRDHDSRPWAMGAHTYMGMFVANHFEPLRNTVLLGKGASNMVRRVDPGIEIAGIESQLPDRCYVVVPGNVFSDEGHSWRVVHTVNRKRRWFVSWCDCEGGLAASVGKKLSPLEEHNIYYTGKDSDDP